MRLSTSLLACALLLLFGAPAFFPLVESIRFAPAPDLARDGTRWLSLTVNTVQLVTLASIVAIPTAMLLSFLLDCCDIPGRGVGRWALFAVLLLPIPVLVTAWQAALAQWTAWRPLGNGLAAPWQPWNRGLVPAAWVHGMIAIPWLTSLGGLAVRSVEPAAVEDATTRGNALRRLRYVWLPRLAPVLALAMLGLTLQISGEIAVTDVMQVRTFAEEVYTQFVLPEVGAGDDEPRRILARAVAAAWPAVGVALVAAVLIVPSGRRTLSGAIDAQRSSSRWQLGVWRWPLSLLLSTMLALVVGAPLGSLLAIAGNTGQGWSMQTLGAYLTLAWESHGRLLLGGGSATLAIGVLLAVVAMVCHLEGRDAPSLRWIAGGTALILACLPGPVIGVGLKLVIGTAVDLDDRFAGYLGLALLLYDGPSLLPVLWATALRVWPLAYLLTLPTAAAFPARLRDLAQLDTARPWFSIIWPMVGGATLRSGLVVGLIALGDVGASKLVATPRGDSFALIVFARMHYGINPHLAALCLFQAAFALFGVLGVVVLARPRQFR